MRTIRIYKTGAIITCIAFFLCHCTEKKEAMTNTSFTRVDSLTETYLALQDSMLRAWNVMINDDNLKIKAMHNLVHELMVSGKTDNEELVSLEQRLEQLSHLRYSQKTMANADVVEEYDFASSSLISEMISIAESRPEFNYNSTLQKLAEEITEADQRVNNWREEYDVVAAEYNSFLDKNQEYLKNQEHNVSLEKKPLFQMASEE
jgi:hypothetical protein